MNPWMERAIQLGEKGRFTAPPNPWVGCVIVQNNTLVGEGFSSPVGGPHAEVHALKQAGSHAKGATLYVTLEPCCHHGKTPPCTDAIIEAGIKEVVVGVEDPDSRVQGKGIATLKEKGIIVRTGVMEQEVTASLRSYLHHRKTGLPYVILKSALSLDGAIAAPDGTSQWLSSPESLEASQELRAASQAIMVGSETALHDQPRLTVRKYPLKPLRIVIDRQGRLPPKGPLFDPSLAPTCIFTEHPRVDWGSVEVVHLLSCSLPAVLHHLGKRGILQLLVEGGASLFSAFIQEELFQECELDIAPLFLGKGARSLSQLPLLNTLSQSKRLQLLSVETLGDTIRARFIKANQTRNIEVTPYNPKWPHQFEEASSLIRITLGNNCLAVHHIGSTSVPGLAAKPKIDIIAVVKDGLSSIPVLEQAGFAYKGEWNIPFKYGFTKREAVEINLHVYEEGHPEIELNLLFRDYLRTHPAERDEYAALKTSLLQDKNSFEKQAGSRFSGYNLGKDAFIRTILNQLGFNRLRLLKCAHHDEWSAAKNFRKTYFFKQQDPYEWTFNHPEHEHLILCQGTTIVGYAHVQLWEDQRAILRILVIEEAKRKEGFGRQFLTLIEKWLKRRGILSLHVASCTQALAFYKNLGYLKMPLHDPDGYPEDPQDTPMGKMFM